jgi:hypothetical protein
MQGGRGSWGFPNLGVRRWDRIGWVSGRVAVSLTSKLVSLALGWKSARMALLKAAENEQDGFTKSD